MEPSEIRYLSVVQKNLDVPTQVLVIDDCDDLRTLVVTILEMSGVSVRTAESGAEALRILTLEYEPDLILLDVRMEGMSGPDFLKILTQKRPDLIKGVPVVFLSGMDYEPVEGSAGFIRKPIVDVNQFVVDIKQFIEDGIKAKRLLQ